VRRAGLLSLLLFCALPVSAANGTIEGLVTFTGETAPRAMFANRDDHDCPHGIAQNHLEVRQQNLGIRNVLIILEAAGAREVQSRQAKLSVKGCVLSPRIQWVSLGTSLQVTNEDPGDHRIHAFLKTASAFDVPLKPGQQARRPIVQPGFYKVNCDRHPWERAWIYASEHPYVAITDTNGRFQISEVPPGRYAIRAWHEGWQEQGKDSQDHLEFQPMEETRDVKVQSKRTASVRFDNLSPAPEGR